MSVLDIVKKELVCHIANWLVLFLILKSIIICSVKFFLYDLLYTSFSSFKTEYIYEKQYNKKGRAFLRSTAFLIISKKNRGTLRKRPTVFNLYCVLLNLNCWAHLQYNAAPPTVAIKSEVFFWFNTNHGFLLNRLR